MPSPLPADLGEDPPALPEAGTPHASGDGKAPPSDDRPDPAPTTRAGAEVWRALRPWLFLVVAAAAVAMVTVLPYDPTHLVSEYALRAGVTTLVLLGAGGWAWARRRGWRWGTDLVPAFLGGIGGLTVAVSLNGTPYPPGGLSGDQTFRIAAITRYADGWHLTDFTFQGLPAFYAPAYFWILGRAAAVAELEAWRTAKYGAIFAAVLVPVAAYLLWRRLVSDPVAALIAAVPLLVENFYEPYAWLVLVAIVPWWLEVVHGLRRPGRPPGNPLLLGLIGAALFFTYYYFFFIAGIALVLHLVVERLLGGQGAHERRLRHDRWRRAILVLAIAAVATAGYWLPLSVSILQAEHAQSMANRWFADSHPQLPLPMLQVSVTGALSLLGLIYLVWTVRRNALSRGLLVLLAAAYAWYLIGAAAAAADMPLLSFRGKPLIPLILVTGGVLALAHLARQGVGRYGRADVFRLAWTVGLVLVIFAAQSFVTTVRDSSFTEAAHATALPDGSLPSHAPADTPVPDPPPAELHQAISERLEGEQPVLVTDRADLMALYPYWGFLQWNAHYAHPASEFDQRAGFLAGLAAAENAEQFAQLSADNRFDTIDAFVLRADGDDLVLRYAADDFPHGLRTEEVRFPRELFADFELTQAGPYVIAAPR